MEQLKKDIHDNKYALIIIIIYFVIMQIIFGTVCPFRAIFNIDCPGCGLTRATIELFKGNVSKSLAYNPTCILWLLVLLLFIIDRYIKPLKIKVFPFMVIIVGIITLLWYFFIK